MRARQFAPFIIILTAFLALLALYGVGTLLTNNLLEHSKEASYKLMRDVLASSLRSNEERAVVRAEMITSMPSVRAAYLAKDRPKLLAETKAAYKLLDEKYGVNVGQFHTAPGVSFLRLHEPDKFGDDQTPYRPILADVNSNAAIRRGISVSRNGPAIYGIVPIADDAGKQVGDFEIGMELAPILDRLKDSYHIEATAFVDEKLLKDVATSLGGDVVSQKNRVGRYIRFHATHPKLAQNLVNDKEVEVRDPTTYEKTYEGTLWGVQLVPMYDYAGKQIGVFAVAENLADIKTRANRAKIWQALAGVFALVFIAGIVAIVIRGMVLSPVETLGLRLAALADGDTSQPADPAGTYCEELQPMVKAYEKLRVQKAES